jgi:hypothetical protein
MKKIINALIIIGYVWLAFVGVYEFAIPLEIKQQLPIDTKMFVFSAGFTGALSSALLYMKNFTNNSQKLNVTQFKTIRDEFGEVFDKINKLDSVVVKQNTNINRFNELKEQENIKLDESIKLQKETNKLLRLELESRITNPLIDNDIKDKIKAVLDNETDTL